MAFSALVSPRHRLDPVEMHEQARLINEQLNKLAYPVEERYVKSVFPEKRLHELHQGELLGAPSPGNCTS